MDEQYFITEDEISLWDDMTDTEQKVYAILCDWRTPDNRLDYMEIARLIAQTILSENRELLQAIANKLDIWSNAMALEYGDQDCLYEGRALIRKMVEVFGIELPPYWEEVSSWPYEDYEGNDEYLRALVADDLAKHPKQ